MKKVVVTGATSMIGVSVIEWLLKFQVQKIYAVVRPDSEKKDRLPQDDRIQIVECDLCEYSLLKEDISEICDTFYHFAWVSTGLSRDNSVEDQYKNIGYSLDALHAAYDLGCNKFIGAGSQAEYGLVPDGKIGVFTPANPIQPYGVAKYAAGKLCAIEASKLGMDCVWVRIFSIYGEYDKETSMIKSSLNKFLNGDKASFTKGEQVWDYLYSNDAGEALALIGEKVTGNKIYCLGSGEPRKLIDYIEEMRDLVDHSIEIGVGEIPYKEGTVMNLNADISELEQDIGWEPTTDFSMGIKNIIDFLKGERKENS